MRARRAPSEAVFVINSRMIRNGLVLLIVVVLGVIVLAQLAPGTDSRANAVPLSAVADEIKAGNVQQIIVKYRAESCFVKDSPGVDWAIVPAPSIRGRRKYPDCTHRL